MPVNNTIFVYGTLMEEFSKDIVPKLNLHIKRKKNGKINARLFDLGEYPGVRPTTIQSKEVVGEIYEIDRAYFDTILSILDDYEGYDPKEKKTSLYLRKITQVTTEDGKLSAAWVYWYNKTVRNAKEIETGDYKKYLTRNK